MIEWLKGCNLIRKLDFNSNDQIKSVLNTAIQKRILPTKLETLKNRNKKKTIRMQRKTTIDGTIN